MTTTMRLAVLAYDTLAALCFGAAAAGLASVAVPGGWPMPVAMIAGMVAGVCATIPLLAVFAYVLGGFEILVLAPQVGMVAGMVGAMTSGGDAWNPLASGAVVGLAVHAALLVTHRVRRGEVTQL